MIAIVDKTFYSKRRRAPWGALTITGIKNNHGKVNWKKEVLASYLKHNQGMA